jgi:cytosine/adenosine deaminase-related metal-dependent hydrolase
MYRPLAALLFTLLAACTSGDVGPSGASFAPPSAEARIVYRGFTLIDGSGGPARSAMAVVTRGETIEAVLPSAELTEETLAGAQLVDLSGHYLLPGLIDAHQHLATPPDRLQAEALMRRDLYSGITAGRIMADDLRSIAELARAARAGEIAGPDLHYAALVAGPSFFEDPRTQAVSAGWTPGEAPWAQAIDESTDLPLAIARARGTGAVALKIYANLPPTLVSRLAAEAHRQGLRVGPWRSSRPRPNR